MKFSWQDVGINERSFRSDLRYLNAKNHRLKFSTKAIRQNDKRKKKNGEELGHKKLYHF